MSSSLSLILEYSDYSETDEIDNIDEETDKLNQNHKISTRLPVPQFIAKEKVEVVYENCTDRNGKIRNFPHERGNWASYFYIPCDNYTAKIIQASEYLLQYFSEVAEFHPVDNFHISLSRTLVFKFHWINELVLSFKKSLSNTPKFSVSFESVSVYCNDEKTRTFIGLTVGEAFEDNLKYLTGKINSLLEDYKLMPFYENPSFHVSVIWCLGDKKAEIEKLISLLDFHSLDLNFDLDIDALLLKTGNKLFSCELN